MKLRAGLVVLGILVAAGCGKKGPPLPPLVRLPVAPADFAAARRGPTVSVRFVVPSRNTDGSTPAEVARVDVYALNGLSTLTPDEILKRGSRVGSVPVNPARDPDAPPGEESKAVENPKDGVDQGTAAHVDDAIALAGVAADTVRSYLAVGVTERGRRGPFSARALVPMGPAPSAPPRPTVTYDEKTITIAWAPPVEAGERPAGYHVYALADTETRLTDRPTRELTVTDSRMEWSTERCYAVRSVASIDTLTLEGDASPRACVTLTDTFPPAAPTGLQTVPDTGGVNLIWNSNEEPDLAGYFVLRAIAPSTTLAAVNTTPIQEPTFRDSAPSGARVIYAIQAVDKAGNVSLASERREETSR